MNETDGSPAICDRYAEIDERVKVIHTPNRGLSAARNLALERAKGQYFGFVDSDDYVETNMFEKLHAGIKESGCDICACGSLREAGGKVARKYTYNQNAVLDQAGFLELFFDEFNCVNMWNKLFRAEVFRGIRFPEGHNYEDVWIFPEILDQDVRIYVMRDALYHSCRPIRISPVKKLAIKAMERCPDVAKNLFLEYRKDEWTM